MNPRVGPWGLLLALSPAGCGSSSEAGIELSVVSAPVMLEPGETFASVEGQELRLADLYWATTAIELVPCASLARKAWDLLVPSAHAHGVASPRRLSVPVVEHASQREPVTLGTLRPAAGSYCSVRYELGMADRDALGLEDMPAMQGRSLDAVGTFATAAAESEPFEITSRRAIQLLRPIALELSEATPRATLRIQHEKAGWFVGIALTELDVTAQEQRLLDNFAASTSIQVE